MKKIRNFLTNTYHYLGGCNFLYIFIICSLLLFSVHREGKHTVEFLGEIEKRQSLLDKHQLVINRVDEQQNLINEQSNAIVYAGKIIAIQKDTIKQLVRELERLQNYDPRRDI
jgi:hypothetical protein